MEKNTSLFRDSQRYNLISPTAHETEVNLLLKSNYPTVEDWNNTLFNCLQSESNIQDHLQLHIFLNDWSTVLEKGWLRLLLTRGYYSDHLFAENANQPWHLNGSEKILIQLLSVLLKAHESEADYNMRRRRIPNLAKAFNKSEKTIRRILKFEETPVGSIKLQNIKQVLTQSLNWRLATGINQLTLDPLFLFVFHREEDWLECQINRIEEEIILDFELSRWLANKCIAPLIRYLIVTKHNLGMSNDILNQIFVGGAHSNSVQVCHQEENVSILSHLLLTEGQNDIGYVAKDLNQSEEHERHAFFEFPPISENDKDILNQIFDGGDQSNSVTRTQDIQVFQEEENVSILSHLLLAEAQNDIGYDTKYLNPSEERERHAFFEFPPLSENDKLLVNQVMYGPGPLDEIIATIGTSSVQRGSMQTLRPGVWINDEIIHYFMTLLSIRDAKLCEEQQDKRRSHFFPSFFLTKLLVDDNKYNFSNVKRWSRKVPGKDIFALEKLFFPVNILNTHWSFAVAYMQYGLIQMYDSKMGIEDDLIWLQGIFDYIQDEHMATKHIPLPHKEMWKLVPCQTSCPQQENNFDCGLFTCAFADFLSRDKELCFGQNDITELRQQMALSIIKRNTFEKRLDRLNVSLSELSFDLLEDNPIDNNLKEQDATAANAINVSDTEEEDEASIKIKEPEDDTNVDASCSDQSTEERNDVKVVKEDFSANSPLPEINGFASDSLSDAGEYRVARDEITVDYPDANCLRKIEYERNIFENIEEHKRAVHILTAAVKGDGGWKHAVVLADVPEFEKMITLDQAVQLHKKLLLLKYAITYALEHPEISWKSILMKTVALYDFEGLRSIRSLQRTFATFKKHNLQLPHPNTSNVDSVKKTIRNTTSNHFLEIYPDLKNKFLSFSRENIRRFSLDLMHHFVNENLLPQLKNEIRCALHENKNQLQNDNLTEEENINKIIKKQFGFLNGRVSRTTVYTWIRKLDNTYGPRKKGFFNDRHEEQKKQREEYIKKRFEDEIYQPVWVQKQEKEFNNLQKEGILSKTLKGHRYKDDLGTDMVEFHVDCDKGDSILNEMENNVYGGNFSVRRLQNDPQIIVMGHDEATMKQHQFTPCHWTMGDGTAALVPKTEGAGVMFSLFVSRAFGAGFRTLWNDEIKEKVNQSRQGKKYLDEEAAMAVLGKTEKDPLLTDPANREFFYGGENGYWDGNCLVIQTEDVLDVFFVACPDFIPLLLFDNSTGHSKGRKNGLNVNNMNKNYGGKQQKLHSSVITAKCLGPYSPKLRPGDIQTFTFEEGDEGPFYLDQKTREAKKYDSFTGKYRKAKPLTNSELTEKLKGKGIIIRTKKKRLELVELAAHHGIPLTHAPENIQEGWMKKPKGMLQVLYERGFINPIKWSEYQVNAPCDAFGAEDKSLSLRDILASCEDFENEQTQLEWVITELGGRCQMSPKYHPEIAGEGIEYLWGYIKKLYRTDWSIREAKDQKEADFLRLIGDIMNGNDGRITSKVVRKSSRRQRDYMIAYSLIQKKQEQQEKGNKQEDPETENEYDIMWGAEEISISHALIEKVLKQIRSKKTHRSPRDLDTAFINTL